METTIKFTTHANPSRQGMKKGPCIGRITHNGTLGGEVLVEALVAKTGFNPIQTDAFLNALAAVIPEGIAAGKIVDLGALQLRLSISGTFPSANAPYDPSVNRLEPYLVPGKSLMTAVNRLSPVNATTMDRPWLYEVGCDGHRSLNEIGLGEAVSINGQNIRIDTSREDEGIWLEDDAFVKQVQAEIIATDSAHAVCKFLPGSLAPGKYRLALYTRDGTVANGQVAVVRRIVKVVE